MFVRVVSLTVLFLHQVHCNGLTQEELCATDERLQLTNLKVNVAFKIGNYITLIGQLWRESEFESQAKNTTIRVLHIPEKLDPSRPNKPYNFFDAKVWNEIQKIANEKQIKYAFTTDNINGIFNFQIMSEILFLVQDTNTTTAYQFEYNKIESSEEPTFNPVIDKKQVYEPTDGYDESEYLNIKFLLVHFPYGVTILSVMVFDRIRSDVVYDDNLKKNKVITQSYTTHYAIVYTEEMYQGKLYYFRHYMKSERHQYRDFKGSRDYTFHRLDWFFDENIQFCDELSKAPTAVTLLYKKETLSATDGNKLDIHFIEFYGLKHKLMKITFEPNSADDRYVIDEERSGQEMDNAEAFLNCKSHPILSKPTPVPCIDYPDEIKDGLAQLVDTLYQSQGSDHSISLFFKFVIIVTIVVMAVLMGVGIYLTVSL